MIETIIKKLLDRDECDYYRRGCIGFRTNDLNIRMSLCNDEFWFIIEGDDFVKEYDVYFKSEQEQKYLEYRFTYLRDNFIENVENKLYKEVMGLNPPEEPTFDQAQSEIVNNVEE